MCVAVILIKQIKKFDNPSTRTFLIVKNVINSPNRLKRLQTALYENRYKIEIFEKVQVRLRSNLARMCFAVYLIKQIQNIDNPPA